MDQNDLHATRRPSLAWAGLGMLAGAACGALAMYMADPQRGRRRRALAKDKMYSMKMRTGKAFDVARRDLGNRAQGLRIQAGQVLRRRPAPDDQILVAHIRQKIGRAIAHARPIHVQAVEGMVTLSGPVLEHERETLLNAVRRVPGVQGVEDRMDGHETAENISSLQGDGRPRHEGPKMRWTPASRALAALGGGTLGMVGLARHTPAAMLMGAAGLGLLVRGMRGPFSGRGRVEAPGAGMETPAPPASS